MHQHLHKPEKNIALEKLGLTNTFKVIVSGENEIESGKPAPDIFLKATEKLEIDPNLYIVLENTQNHVQIAKPAAIYCCVVGVYNQLSLERL